ncbi:MAG: di-trans,poly-cis-decaprenylcistransferase [Rhodobacter sp.]|jgi:undecaprenyl diphosphate synthase|nr:di-trans,poly-cis-decaprenylcistransferase [Rhodobacter sp.]
MRHVLTADTETPRKIKHVAIIMDGNGRWATRRGLPRLVGHRKGAERVHKIVDLCPDIGVKYLTLFAFSTENWKRAETEVAGLMSLFRRYIVKEANKLHKNKVRVRFIGDRTRLDPKLIDMMAGLEEKTALNEHLNLTIALNYGGRDELTRAMRLLAEDVAVGNVAPRDITDESVGFYLDTRYLPDPDLVIRTSGEKRISNFLLWQSAYAEYEFVPTLWPDFTADDFADIVLGVGNRHRRYGAVAG